jgi:hypothetical protein
VFDLAAKQFLKEMELTNMGMYKDASLQIETLGLMIYKENMDEAAV